MLLIFGGARGHVYVDYSVAKEDGIPRVSTDGTYIGWVVHAKLRFFGEAARFAHDIFHAHRQLPFGLWVPDSSIEPILRFIN